MDAKELNDLADRAERRPHPWGITDPDEKAAVVAGLRTLATLKEFGELPGYNLFRDSVGKWHAPASTFARSVGFSTPIEAMHAAIDAAKPKHEHELHWMWAGTADRPTFHVATCNWCDHAESSDHLVPAPTPCKHPGWTNGRWTNGNRCTECGKAG